MSLEADAVRSAVEDAMRSLNGKLHEQLLSTGLVTVDQWNAEIAPALKGVASALLGSPVHPRSYRVHESVYPVTPRPEERALKVVREMIRGNPIEHAIVDLSEPDVGLGAWIDRLL